MLYLHGFVIIPSGFDSTNYQTLTVLNLHLTPANKPQPSDIHKHHLISENITQTCMQQAKTVDLWGVTYTYIYICREREDRTSGFDCVFCH